MKLKNSNFSAEINIISSLDQVKESALEQSRNAGLELARRKSTLLENAASRAEKVSRRVGRVPQEEYFDEYIIGQPVPLENQIKVFYDKLQA